MTAADEGGTGPVIRDNRRIDPATGEVLAPAVLDGRPALDLAPFSVARFDNRSIRGEI